jgi:hypothetical protein
VKYHNVYEVLDIGIVRAEHVQKHDIDGIQQPTQIIEHNVHHEIQQLQRHQVNHLVVYLVQEKQHVDEIDQQLQY